jgi:hypothetical protein
VLAATLGLASIVGPLFFSTFYCAVQKERPGAVFLLAVALYAVAVPLAFIGTPTVLATKSTGASEPLASIPQTAVLIYSPLAILDWTV